MAIAVDDSFEARARADTEYANLVGVLSTVVQVANLIVSLSTQTPRWTGIGSIMPSQVDTSGAPTFTGEFQSPGTPPTPGDYVAAMQAAFLSADVTTQNDVITRVSGWLGAFSPSYLANAAALDAMLAQDAQTGDPLGEPIQTALYTEAQNKIDAAAKSAYETSMRTARGAGWEVIQPTQEAVAYRLAQSTADQEVAAALEAYVKVYGIRVSHKEFCMKTQTDIRNATQATMLGIAQIVAAVKKFALEYGGEVGRLGALTFQSQIEGFKAILETNIKTFETLVEKNNAELASYRTRLGIQLENNRVTLDANRVQLANEEIPFKAEHMNRLSMYENRVKGLESLSSSLSNATSALGHVAAAAESVMNTIVASTENT